MKKETGVFLNFPIYLLRGFMDNSKVVLERIMQYACYDKSLKILNNTEFSDLGSYKAAFTHFGIKFDNEEAYKKSLKEAKSLYSKSPGGVAFVGINREVFFDFYNGRKSHSDKAELLMFLALKSIIGSKQKVCSTDGFMFARMDGSNYSYKYASEVTCPILAAYWTRRKRENLIKQLRMSWGLKYYSRYMRGFYFTFKEDVSLEDLILYAETQREANKSRKLDDETRAARREALKKMLF